MSRKIQVEKAILAVINPENAKMAAKLKSSRPADVIQEAADRLTKSRGYQTKNKVSNLLGNQFQMIAVQYNPATLSLSAYGEDTTLESSRETDQKKQVKQNIKPGMVTLSMDLVVEGKETKEWSQKLLTMLQSSVTQAVIFCWGTTIFPGKLTKADTEYTMFSPLGSPMMGKVSVSIQQESPEEGAYWKRAFQACFKNYQAECSMQKVTCRGKDNGRL